MPIAQSDTFNSGKSDSASKNATSKTPSGMRVNVHHLVQPFYENLDMLDFLTAQRMNVLAKKQDKSKVMHRDEREYMRGRRNLH